MLVILTDRLLPDDKVDIGSSQRFSFGFYPESYPKPLTLNPTPKP